MTLAPRFLVNFWTGLRVAFSHRKQATLQHSVTAQRSAFTQLMQQAAGTEFGQQHNLDAGTTYAQFCERVPPRHADSFRSSVARMIAGEVDVLVPGKCTFFVETAGTTTAETSILPVPDPMLAHFRRGLRDALFHHAARAGHCGVFLGRHVHLGASTALVGYKGKYRTSLDGVLALCLTPWVKANLYAPAPEITQLPEGPAKTAATLRSLQDRDVTLIGGTPASLHALAREAGPAGSLPALWPNLECCLRFGAPLGLYGESLRALLGPAVTWHEVYAAAEGIFAAQDEGHPKALRLLAATGVFFEFLPLDSYQETTVEQAGSLCLPLNKVQPGVDYVLIVTTPAGLTRYVTGDIVRFVSVDPPRLVIAGRTKLQLNTFGERVSERDIFETMRAVCEHNGWMPVAFHVAPFEQRISAGQVAHVHEWWLELGTHTVRTPTANVLGPAFDSELIARNRNYGARREQGVLGAPQVRLVMPGVFAQWARDQRKTASASKLPRCRPDRLIADQLVALSRFHQPTIAPFRKAGSASPGLIG